MYHKYGKNTNLIFCCKKILVIFTKKYYTMLKANDCLEYFFTPIEVIQEGESFYEPLHSG